MWTGDGPAVGSEALVVGVGGRAGGAVVVRVNGEREIETEVRGRPRVMAHSLLELSLE